MRSWTYIKTLWIAEPLNLQLPNETFCSFYRQSFFLQLCATVKINYTLWSLEQWMNEAVFQVWEFVLCLLFWASAFRLLSCELLLILHVWQGLFPLCHINQGKKQQQKVFCANSRLCLMYSISRDATFSPQRQCWPLWAKRLNLIWLRAANYGPPFWLLSVRSTEAIYSWSTHK